ncbi:MAG: AAA family ATPase [Isosphaeraceae bacterium]
MIERVYIDNYKCFVNFELHLRDVQLIMGGNGSGKTTFFDVIESVRDFLTEGNTTSQSFPASTLTIWDPRRAQKFELGIKGTDGVYFYRLVVEHDPEKLRNRIANEELRFDQKMLYQFDGKDAHLFRDDGSAGPVFPLDWSRSGIPTIPERRDNTLLTGFRRRLERIFIFSPDPLRMTGQSDAEVARPGRRLHDVVSWLRHLSQESFGAVADIQKALKEGVLEGFVRFNLAKAGETTRVLKFDFQYEVDAPAGAASPKFSLNFDQLSDGQRNLVALFTILHSAVGADTTLCLDEPDNYVALREIQPWLIELVDRARTTAGQCLLISHHPELINYLAPTQGVQFFRDNLGPVRTTPFQTTEDERLLPAEIVARGWE